MSAPGEIERHTQNRLKGLFRDQLNYSYLGNWQDRVNSNIESGLLHTWLTTTQGYDAELAKRAIGQLERATTSGLNRLYDRNRAVYDLLRYGVKIKRDAAEQYQTIWLIDWKHPERNSFALAEEVTIEGAHVQAHAKRPDLVVYVNGIALGVIELKRSIVSVAEGIRQNLDSQKPDFIEHFFTTVQLVCAGNDTEGLRYGVIETKEKYYLTWKEPSAVESPLDRSVLQVFEKGRFLELIHDFQSFDAGMKKISRPNQYFGVRAAQEFIDRGEGGIIWHAQGTGKSLTMVWLARWIREHVREPRVLIVTDRIELDEQIERIFLGVNEQIERIASGADLIAKLNTTLPWLMCSLIHKFGAAGDESEPDVASFVTAMKAAIPAGFSPKGNIIVFVDECHRSQSNLLHEAMKAILPGATFIGFTGTPLLKTDKKTSLEVFGRYIHTYRFDEAVADKVILDLRYEARDIEQRLVSREKIDAWFEAKTKALTPVAQAQLKRRWGTLQEVFSSRSRLEQIVSDVLMDMEIKERLTDQGHGNALLVSDSIYNACKFYELFAKAGLRRKCAIVTSYRPTAASLKGEDSGEGDSERLEQYEIYKAMLADWFGEAAEIAVTKADEFEKQVKDRFIKVPGQMKLLIVVDKLLTGFDAPSATYLYIDKPMRDHGLFQAICRVNRLDTPDKEYGYIVDYRDLFGSLRQSVLDYTTGALSGYEASDITGLLKNRLEQGRKDLDEALEAVVRLCEPVAMPRNTTDYLHYFCASGSADQEELEENLKVRSKLYSLVGHLVRAYADIANDMPEGGYTTAQIEKIKADVNHYEKVRTEVKLASGDYIDMKMYEPAMRHLIDTFIAAEASQKVSAFDDLSLIQLIVEQGPDAVKDKNLPADLRASESTMAETMENNVRRLLVDRTAINPRYYEAMSKLLDALIKERHDSAIAYQEYLKKITELTRKIDSGPEASAYPLLLDTQAKRALYDNTGHYESLAIELDAAIRDKVQDDWRNNAIKTRRIRNAIVRVLGKEDGADEVLDLVRVQREY